MGEAGLEAPKNLHLVVLEPESKIDQKHVNSYAFFHVHCSTKSKKNSKRSKTLNSQVSYPKKCVCSIFLLNNIS